MRRFEEDLLVVLNSVPYFQASAVTHLAARDNLPSSHCLRIHRNSTLSKSAGDNSKTLLATDSSTR